MKTKRKVWFHRARAIAWAVAYPVTVALGLHNSVSLVWFASAYANVVSDWGASEAADDREMLAEIRALRDEIRELREEIRCEG